MEVSLPNSDIAAGPAPATDSPVKVLYIGGLGRSGSTLLDCILGQLPGFFSAGEIRDLWDTGLRENRLCGCGRPFLECEFWSAVGLEAYGGWDVVNVERAIRLARTVDRHSRWPFLVRPRLWPSFDKALREYAALLSALYRAIASTGHARVVIDSSKAPSTAFVLRNVPDLDVRAVHLIRDSRGVAFSWSKRVLRPDTPMRTVYMHRYHPLRTGMRWITRNSLMEIIGGLGIPEVRVRYEGVVHDPRREVLRIVRMFGERVTESDMSFVRPGEVLLGPNHTVMGNPVRMRSGPMQIRLDTEWRRSMDATQRRAVTLLTWPMLRRYGYER
jgi:hypothetical protein